MREDINTINTHIDNSNVENYKAKNKKSSKFIFEVIIFE